MIDCVCGHCEKTFKGTKRSLHCSRSCAAKSRTGSKNSNWKGGLVEVACEECGKLFTLKRKDTKGTLGRFCSRACWGKSRSREFVGETGSHWQGGPITIACEQCGDTFKVPKSREPTARFCSYGCYGLWQSENLSGVNSPLWEGGCIRYYGPNWESQKRRARARDDYTCQECGATEDALGYSLSVHHEEPFKSFGYIPGENDHYKQANELANLTSLCRICHLHVEWRQGSFDERQRSNLIS